MPPGSVVTPPSVLVTTRSGPALIELLYEAELLSGLESGPCVPSSAIFTVLRSDVTPAGTGFGTFTAKMTDPLAPAGTLPSARVNAVVPTGVQPGVLAAASKVVPTGRNSVR